MRSFHVPVRTTLTALGALGVALLLLATLLTVIQIEVGTVSELDGFDTTQSGWDRHGPALLLLGALAGVMLLGARRGARPAMVAVAALGAAVLLIALLQDVPDAGETGAIGAAYADARAVAGPGFWAEVVGALLLLGSGAGLLGTAHQQRPDDLAA